MTTDSERWKNLEANLTNSATKEQFAEGLRAVVAPLVVVMHGKITAIARRFHLNPDELMHECILELLSGKFRTRLDRNRGTLDGLLARMFSRVAIRLQKKAQRHRERQGVLLSACAEMRLKGPLQVAIDREVAEFVRRAVRRLREKDRRLAELLGAGNSRSEIADALGISVGAASKRVQRLFKKLRPLLKDLRQ